MLLRITAFLCIVYMCQLHSVIALQKYEFISDCIFYDRSRTPGNDNVTFICSNDRDNRVFQDLNRIRCSKFTSSQDFKWPGTVDFQDCRFTEMPKNFFHMLYNMHTFLMPNVELESLQMDIFREAKNVSKLNLSRNKLKEIPALIFVNAINLKDIDLSNNLIARVDKMAFEGGKSIEILNLSCNHLTRLEALSSPKLITLDVSRNNITNFDDNFFGNLSDLKYLNLSFNPLGKLKANTFDRLLYLEELNLRQINLSTIETGTFSHQHKLTFLDLNENNLKTFDFDLFFPIAHDLRTLRLGGNQLTHLDGLQNELFPQLSLLDIQGNQFNCSYLWMFMTFLDWEHLHLHLDIDSMNATRPNIRGINCDEINSTDSTVPTRSEPNSKQQSQLSSPTQIPYQYEADDAVQKVTLIILCAAFVIYLMLYVLVNRDKIHGTFSKRTVSFLRRNESSRAVDNAEFSNNVMLLE